MWGLISAVVAATTYLFVAKKPKAKKAKKEPARDWNKLLDMTKEKQGELLLKRRMAAAEKLCGDILAFALWEERVGHDSDKGVVNEIRSKALILIARISAMESTGSTGPYEDMFKESRADLQQLLEDMTKHGL